VVSTPVLCGTYAMTLASSGERGSRIQKQAVDTPDQNLMRENNQTEYSGHQIVDSE
jgi:hypothetical protein